MIETNRSLLKLPEDTEAGLAKSAAKTAAVRENGKLGGRPKKPKRSTRRQNEKGQR